ncbi:hypothetical protein BJV82DRAFT_605941 [Fennellomyces sp. T-0311]|nr:hypothetical protein BJV82DRAFT_605941 [Fennellomyces sp. T-0311]
MTSSGVVGHHCRELGTANVSPSQGPSGTEITVWVPLDIFPPQHTMHHSAVCIAFQGALLHTEIITPADARGWVSLVCVAPPHSHLHTANSDVPIYVCFIQDNLVTQNWLVGKFTYIDLPIDTSPTKLTLTQPWPAPDHRSGGESGPCSAVDEYQGEKIHFASDTMTEAPTASNVVRQNRLRQSSKKPRPQMGVTLEDYTPYPKIDHPAELQFMGDFHGLAWDWTPQEVHARRRLVRFWRVLEHNSSPFIIRCAFKVISIEEYHHDRHEGVVVSCIAYGDDLYVTSVDIINLLESILCCQFSIDEKNRVRRNLEGFHPMTASKYHEASIDLFRHIMGFTEPKPRNIEKDIKIFPWHILPYAAKKIIVKHLSTRQDPPTEYGLPAFPQPPPMVYTYSTDQYEYSTPMGPLTPQDTYPVYRKD